MEPGSGKFEREENEDKKFIVNSIERALFVERLPNVRTYQRWNKQGVLPYDYDNLYPNKVRSIAQRSGTTISASETWRDFVIGEGFGEELNKIIINQEGQSLEDLLFHAADEQSLFNGYAIHINYNRFGQATDFHEILFENVRWHKSLKFLIWNPDWLRYDKKNDIIYHPFNPDNAINEINEVGFENYNGQMLYWTIKPQVIYPIAHFDSVLDDSQFEAESKLYKLSNIQNRYAAEFLFRYPFQLDTNDEIQEAKKELKKGSGSNYAGKTLIVPDVLSPDGKQQNKMIEEIPRTGIDKLFESQNKETKDNIFEAYRQPKVLSGKNKEGGFSKDEYYQAAEYYNDILERTRRQLSRTFNALFENSIYNLPELDLQKKEFEFVEEEIKVEKEVQDAE